MLTSLSLRNFVIVEALSLDVASGMTVLTGETGAGKSILIDALKLILGGRADVSTIRSGCDKAEFSATFSLDERALTWLKSQDWLYEPESDLVVRRTIDRSGRSRGWINGMPATIHQLRSLGDNLVEINGQHAYHELLDGSKQLALIDAYGKLTSQRNTVGKAFEAWKNAEKSLRDARQNSEVLRAREERLQWVLDDIGALAPKKDEWTKLNAEHVRLANRSNIMESLSEVVANLSSGRVSATDLVSRSQGMLENLARYDERFSGYAETLGAALDLLEEAARGADGYLSRMDYDARSFEELDERVSAYFNLSLKYKVNPEDLFDYYEGVRNELQAIEASRDLATLEALERQTQQAFVKEAQVLRQARKASAKDFSTAVTKAIKELSLEHAIFEAHILESEPSTNGMDRCEFHFASHPSLPLEALAKSASGGELSRISLAVAVVNPAAMPGTVIFDEADVGIGGAVAAKVGEKFQALAHDHQVLCITHLPQIAGFADHHWKVEKTATAGEVVSSVRMLDENERIAELARMVSGTSITNAEKNVAKNLIQHGTLKK